MPIYKPSELHQFLQSLGISPNKRLSQNFLIDGNILHKIVQTAKISPGDLVVEIGPGPGSLTEQLLTTQAHLIAIEKDPMLAQSLERLKSPENQLKVYCDDILKFPLESALIPYLTGAKKAKLIANLPYHLTTPIIAKLLPERQLFSHFILMVQDEVARRFVAKPKTSDYSAFTVFLNYYSRPSYAFQVSSSCFYPRPKVNSAVVVLELKEPPLLGDPSAFFKLTRTAFGKRRKMLKVSLRTLYPSKVLEKALEEIPLPPTARPEELSLDQFLLLFDKLNNEPPS